MRALAASGKLQEARAVFEAASRRDAIADYDKALEVAPGLMLARFNKAVVLDRAGRLAEATAEYRAFLQDASSDYEAQAAQARQRLATLERLAQE